MLEWLILLLLVVDVVSVLNFDFSTRGNFVHFLFFFLCSCFIHVCKSAVCVECKVLCKWSSVKLKWVSYHRYSMLCVTFYNCLMGQPHNHICFVTGQDVHKSARHNCFASYLDNMLSSYSWLWPSLSGPYSTAALSGKATDVDLKWLGNVKATEIFWKMIKTESLRQDIKAACVQQD